jgi:hypothetical protein
MVQCRASIVAVYPGYMWDGSTVVGKYYEDEVTLVASLVHDVLYNANKNPDNIIFPSPCDMIYDIAVGDDEQKYCFWMAHLMRYLCAHIRLTKNENSFYQNSYSQAIEINEQFFEDLYYCAVYELYITFGKNLQNNENEN